MIVTYDGGMMIGPETVVREVNGILLLESGVLCTSCRIEEVTEKILESMCEELGVYYELRLWITASELKQCVFESTPTWARTR